MSRRMTGSHHPLCREHKWCGKDKKNHLKQGFAVLSGHPINTTQKSIKAELLSAIYEEHSGPGISQRQETDCRSLQIDL